MTKFPLLISALIAATSGLVLMAPSPAAAKEADTAKLADRLSDPGTQAAVTVALTAMSEALLDMKVEPVRRALDAVGDDAATDLPPDARLRDVIGSGSAELPRKIGSGVPRAMGSAAGLAGAFEEVLPELRAAASRLKAALPTR